MQMQGSYVVSEQINNEMQDLIKTGVYPSKNSIVTEGIKRVLKNPAKTEEEIRK